MEPQDKQDMDDPQKSLFRRQAIEVATDRYGAPVSAPGFGMWTMAAFVLLLIVLVVGFMLTTSFPRKETVTGSLVPAAGLLTISSQRSGVVSKVYVEEGASVEMGDPIVRISVDSVIGEGERMGFTLTSLAEELGHTLVERERAMEASLRSQEAAIRARIQGISQQLNVLRGNLVLYEDQAKLADQTVSDLDRLMAQQLVSKLQHRDAETRALAARQNLAELQIRITDQEQESERLKHELSRLSAEHDASHAAIAAERLSAEEKSVNYRAATEFDLISQKAGRITSLHAKAGSSVTAGRTLGVVVPADSQLLAEMWVPSSAIAFVEVGTDVRLMYDAFPYQKFGVAHAKVIRISRSPVSPEELPLDLQAKESRYRVLAELDEQHMSAYQQALALTPGMTLKADLILERRSLMDWLLDPLLAARRRHAI